MSWGCNARVASTCPSTPSRLIFSVPFHLFNSLSPLYLFAKIILVVIVFCRGASTLRLVEIRRARGHRCFRCSPPFVFMLLYITLHVTTRNNGWMICLAWFVQVLVTIYPISNIFSIFQFKSAPFSGWSAFRIVMNHLRIAEIACHDGKSWCYRMLFAIARQ